MKYLNGFSRLIKAFSQNPSVFMRTLNTMPGAFDAFEFSKSYNDNIRGDAAPEESNPIKKYFQDYKEGHGIFKWEHYFDIYHRHLQKFIGKKVNILEIGIYSGGSLEMWRTYFGNQSHIYGIDIEPDCKTYENEYTDVFIGDQEDRNFWKDFKSKVKDIDIIIDDGGHTPEQQQVTLEELLPYMNSGGVYICEDIHENYNRFAAYAGGLVQELNHVEHIPGDVLQCRSSNFQTSIHSIHFYPYITVIEKNHAPVEKLVCSKHGTKWQPFLK